MGMFCLCKKKEFTPLGKKNSVSLGLSVWEGPFEYPASP